MKNATLITKTNIVKKAGKSYTEIVSSNEIDKVYKQFKINNLYDTENEKKDFVSTITPYNEIPEWTSEDETIALNIDKFNLDDHIDDKSRPNNYEIEYNMSSHFIDRDEFSKMNTDITWKRINEYYIDNELLIEYDKTKYSVKNDLSKSKFLTIIKSLYSIYIKLDLGNSNYEIFHKIHNEINRVKEVKRISTKKGTLLSGKPGSKRDKDHDTDDISEINENFKIMKTKFESEITIFSEMYEEIGEFRKNFKDFVNIINKHKEIRIFSYEKIDEDLITQIKDKNYDKNIISSEENMSIKIENIITLSSEHYAWDENSKILIHNQNIIHDNKVKNDKTNHPSNFKKIYIQPVFGEINVNKESELEHINWIASIIQTIINCNISSKDNLIMRIYPQSDGIPIFNPKGKYWIKLFLNGKLRKIEIDDYMPFKDKHINLFPFIKNDDGNNIWILLIFKALLKLYHYKNEFKNKKCDLAYLYSLTNHLWEYINLNNIRENNNFLSEIVSDEKNNKNEGLFICFNYSKEKKINLNSRNIQEEENTINNEEYFKEEFESNVIYDITHYFCNYGFNMNRLKLVEFTDLKKKLEDNKQSYKQLNKEEKKIYLEMMKKLKAEIENTKIERLDDLNKSGILYKIIKLRLNASWISNSPLVSHIQFTDDEIYTARLCMLNNWKFPPLQYYESLYQLKKDENLNESNIINTNLQPIIRPIHKAISKIFSLHSIKEINETNELDKTKTIMSNLDKSGLDNSFETQIYHNLLKGNNYNVNLINPTEVPGIWYEESYLNQFENIVKIVKVHNYEHFIWDFSWVDHKNDIFKISNDKKVVKLHLNNKGLIDYSQNLSNVNQISSSSSQILFYFNSMNDKNNNLYDNIFFVKIDIYSELSKSILHTITLDDNNPLLKIDSNLIENANYLILSSFNSPLGFCIDIYSDCYKFENIHFPMFMSLFGNNNTSFTFNFPNIKAHSLYTISKLIIHATEETNIFLDVKCSDSFTIHFLRLELTVLDLNLKATDFDKYNEKRIVDKKEVSTFNINKMIENGCKNNKDLILKKLNTKQIFLNDYLTLKPNFTYLLTINIIPDYTVSENEIIFNVNHKKNCCFIQEIELIEPYELNEEITINKHGEILKSFVFSPTFNFSTLNFSILKQMEKQAEASLLVKTMEKIHQMRSNNNDQQIEKKNKNKNVNVSIEKEKEVKHFYTNIDFTISMYCIIKIDNEVIYQRNFYNSFIIPDLLFSKEIKYEFIIGIDTVESKEIYEVSFNLVTKENLLG